MLNKLSSVLASGLIAAMSMPRAVGAAEVLDHMTARLGDPSPAGHGYRSRKKLRLKLYERKLHRTTKAEGIYGRNLRAHFDRKRLTRSQLKKFYAGKLV